MKKSYPEIEWIAHYHKLKEFSAQKGPPLRLLKEGKVAIVAHPNIDPVIIDTRVSFEPTQEINKSAQLYLYSCVWILFVDLNDSTVRDFCYHFIESLVVRYESEYETDLAKTSMIHDDHAVSERACVFIFLKDILSNDTKFASLLLRHLKYLYEHIKLLVASDKWLMNNHRLFHLFSLIVIELRRNNNMEAAKSASRKIYCFFDALIDSSTMLSREQSVYYMIFDITLLRRFIPLLDALGVSDAPYAMAEQNKKYAVSLSALAYPDGGLPAFGDTPLGLTTKVVAMPHDQYRATCLLLDELGYHKIYNEHAQAILIAHCAEAAHGHSSPLHVDLWTKAHGLIFTDSGGPYYYGDQLRFTYFRAPVAHNTLSFRALRAVKPQKVSVTVHPERTALSSERVCAKGALTRQVALDGKTIRIIDAVNASAPWQLTWHVSDKLHVDKRNGRIELRAAATGSVVGTLTIEHTARVNVAITSGFLTYGPQKILVEAQVLELSSDKKSATVSMTLELA